MIPQYQTVFHATEGDCTEACIATITGIPLGALPNRSGRDFYPALQEALDDYGWVYYEFGPTDWWWFFGPLQKVPVIASVPSQKFEGKQHALVVCCYHTRLKVIHDPNPNNVPFDKLTPKQVLGWSVVIRKEGLPSKYNQEEPL